MQSPVTDIVFINPNQVLDGVELIYYDSKIYMPQNLRIFMLDWYHLYLSHPGGSILVNTIEGVC